MEDRELLCEYLERQSEQAFAELVARHVNLVYSTALRVVHEPEMALDVAQATSILLARKAKSVRDPLALGGWLYRTASNTAANALRADQRRHQIV
jgi:RNA polymerase sigma factor (sigma-70 family)